MSVGGVIAAGSLIGEPSIIYSLCFQNMFNPIVNRYFNKTFKDGLGELLSNTVFKICKMN